MYQCPLPVPGEDRAEDVPVKLLREDICMSVLRYLLALETPGQSLKCVVAGEDRKMYQWVVAGEDRAEDVPVCCCWGGQS